MQKAVAWGVDAFKAAGADTVHTEDFTLPVSWAEGATEVSVAAQNGDKPVAQFRVRAISIAWAPALPPHRHVRVVDVGDGSAEDFARAGNVAGALLLVHTEEMKKWDDLFAEYLRAHGIIDRALAGKALSIAFQSTRPNDLLYRHTNSNEGELDRLPMVLLAREDAGRMARLLASGQALSLFADISIPNHVDGPITAANVVAELRGSEKPDEFVVLGAHLDSWELGTGALDNGCNAALVLEAARALKAIGLVPKRTIRFILFSGEEQGTIGSFAYVKSHATELEKIRGVIIFDSGSGRVPGYSLGGRRDTEAGLRQILKPLDAWGVTQHTADASFGTDNFDFLLEGVPTFVANNEIANYLTNYHAASDTFDKVDQRELKLNAVIAALTAWGIADRSEPLGKRLSRPELDTLVKETGLDEQMKALGYWEQWQSGARGRKP
jgi:hypothetical protein